MWLSQKIPLDAKWELYALLNYNKEMFVHLIFLESWLYLRLIQNSVKEGGQKTLLQTIHWMNNDKTYWLQYMLNNTWPAKELTLQRLEYDTYIFFIKISLKVTKCQKEKIEHYNQVKYNDLKKYPWKHKGIDMQISILSLTDN